MKILNKLFGMGLLLLLTLGLGCNARGSGGQANMVRRGWQ